MIYNTNKTPQPFHPLGTSKPQPTQQTYRYIGSPYDKRK